jgi:GTP-binding protein HflX
LKTGIPVVSLLGYTSSGKTTLFNLLTHEQKEISGNLFTTLSTTTRSLKINDEGLVVLKMKKRRSLAADLILLLIDCSERIEDIRIKYSSSWDILDELRVDKSKVFIILSKSDNDVQQKKIDEIAADLQILNPVVISAKTGHGIHKLKNMIASQLFQRLVN